LGAKREEWSGDECTNNSSNQNATDEALQTLARRENRRELASTDGSPNEIRSTICRPNNGQEPDDPTRWSTSIKRVKRCE